MLHITNFITNFTTNFGNTAGPWLDWSATGLQTTTLTIQRFQTAIWAVWTVCYCAGNLLTAFNHHLLMQTGVSHISTFPILNCLSTLHRRHPSPLNYVTKSFFHLFFHSAYIWSCKFHSQAHHCSYKYKKFEIFTATQLTLESNICWLFT